MSILYSQDFKNSLVKLHQEGRSLKSLVKVFERQGLEMSTAIKMFLTKTAYEQQIPFSAQETNKQAYPDDWFSD